MPWTKGSPVRGSTFASPWAFLNAEDVSTRLDDAAPSGEMTLDPCPEALAHGDRAAAAFPDARRIASLCCSISGLCVPWVSRPCLGPPPRVSRHGRRLRRTHGRDGHHMGGTPPKGRDQPSIGPWLFSPTQTRISSFQLARAPSSSPEPPSSADSTSAGCVVAVPGISKHFARLAARRRVHLAISLAGLIDDQPPTPALGQKYTCAQWRGDMGVADNRPAWSIGEGLPALSYRIVNTGQLSIADEAMIAIRDEG
ncbi:hypothetical protein MRS44_002872 [Fusarium solani]|jgi:hypothetical protein|nr:hypothetical protein MRS44_002872 [Fusarium solani]